MPSRTIRSYRSPPPPIGGCGVAGGAAGGDAIALGAERREEREPVDVVSRDRERGRVLADLREVVVAQLVDVDADTEHERAPLLVRRGVRERAGDLAPLDLDVVRPF